MTGIDISTLNAGFNRSHAAPSRRRLPMPTDPPPTEGAVERLLKLIDEYGSERLEQQHAMWSDIQDAAEDVADVGFAEGRRQATEDGFARAVAMLRDDKRYRAWWTKLTPADPSFGSGYWEARVRRHLADYLDAVGPWETAEQPEPAPSVCGICGGWTTPTRRCDVCSVDYCGGCALDGHDAMHELLAAEQPEPARCGCGVERTCGCSDEFRCICDPNDVFDPPDPTPRAVEGCPAHRARRAYQQWAAEQSEGSDRDGR